MYKKIHEKIFDRLKDHKQLSIVLLIELLGLLIVIFAAVIELSHIASTSWLSVYLYNGDSLTLPLFRQSLAHKESIMWVCSSQLNLFPEFILYGISSIFAHSVRASLVFNSIFNIVIFYLLLRLLLRVLSKSSRYAKELLALLITLLLIGYMLLESQSTPNQILATYYLFNTYYYGVIVIGLIQLSITLQQVKAKYKLKDKKYIYLSVLGILLSSIAIVSNPLYLTQVLLPLIAALILFWLLKYINFKRFFISFLPLIVALPIGLVGRIFVRSLITRSVNSYLGQYTSFFTWKYNFRLLHEDIYVGAVNNLRVRVILSVLVFFFSLFYALFAINSRLKNPKNKDEKKAWSVFISLFVILEVAIASLSALGITSFEDRYLIAPLIIPLVGLVVIIETKLYISMKRFWLTLMVLIALVVSTIGIADIPKANDLLSSTAPGEQCLEESLGYKPANGIANYWSARSLDVYNSYNERTLQVNNQYKVMAWLNNLASYRNKIFTYIVFSRDNLIAGGINPQTYQPLGKPSRVNICKDIAIYHYLPGTKGYMELNNNIKTSLNFAIKLRNEGTLDEYTNFLINNG